MLIKKCSVAVCVALSVLSSHAASEATYPPAEDLLRDVIRSIPAQPVELLAELQSRSSKDKLDRSIRLEMVLDAREKDYRATYELIDAFGRDTEKLDVQFSQHESPKLTYFLGASSTPSEAPALTSAIQGTDLSWAELSLAFLWWDGAKTVRSESLKGRFCYVVEIPVPKAHRGAYVTMNVWIDPEVKVFLRAEGYDTSQQRVRRMEVKRFKKIDHLWLLKHLEVQSYPSGHRTSLRMRSIKLAGQEHIDKK